MKKNIIAAIGIIATVILVGSITALANPSVEINSQGRLVADGVVFDATDFDILEETIETSKAIAYYQGYEEGYNDKVFEFEEPLFIEGESLRNGQKSICTASVTLPAGVHHILSFRYAEYIYSPQHPDFALIPEEEVVGTWNVTPTELIFEKGDFSYTPNTNITEKGESARNKPGPKNVIRYQVFDLSEETTLTYTAIANKAGNENANYYVRFIVFD